MYNTYITYASIMRNFKMHNDTSSYPIAITEISTIVGIYDLLTLSCFPTLSR